MNTIEPRTKINPVACPPITSASNRSYGDQHLILLDLCPEAPASQFGRMGLAPTGAKVGGFICRHYKMERATVSQHEVQNRFHAMGTAILLDFDTRAR